MSEDQTIAIAQQFAADLKVGDVVALYGDLGAGKTEFVKGICAFFAVDQIVTSPTFTIINQYAGETANGDPVRLYHVDLYRIETAKELADVGFDDCVFAHDAIKLVEWPDKAEHLLPAHYAVTITPDATDDNARTIDISFVREPKGAEKL